MKKTLIIITTLFLSNLANGQLKVFSSGNMSVGTTNSSSTSMMMIDGQDYSYGLYCKNARSSVYIYNQSNDFINEITN